MAFSRQECVASSHVWMWELDHEEGRAQKNGCFWIVLLEKTLISPWTERRSNQSILKEINPEYSLEGWMLKLQNFGHLVPFLTHCRLIGKDPVAGENWRQIEKGMTANETIEWHHWHNGVCPCQGSLACCSSWGHKELDTTSQLKNNSLFTIQY